jgi:hypothetical protein
MSDNLYKYFLIYGINHKNIHNKTYNDLIKAKPSILSSYLCDGFSEEFNILKRTLNEQNKFIDIIFPRFFSESQLISYSTETLSISEQENIFENCVYESKSPLSPFYHSLEIHLSDNMSFHCSIMVIFEELHNNKTEYKDYIGKALILISKYPTYYLSKILLENLVKKISFSLFPLEFIIEEWFSNLNVQSKGIFSNNSSYDFNKHCLLSKCDIDYKEMLSLFKFQDIKTFAEHFFTKQAIIVSSNSLDYVFPIFGFFFSMLYPFNTVDYSYSYRMLNNYNFTSSLTNVCMLGVYCDKLPQAFIQSYQNYIQKKLFHIHVNVNDNQQIEVTTNCVIPRRRGSLSWNPLSLLRSSITVPKNLNLLDYVGKVQLFNIKDFIELITEIFSNNQTNKDINLMRTIIMGIMFSFCLNVIEKLECIENENNESLEIKVIPKEGIEINEHVFDILIKNNFNNENEIDLYKYELIHEIVRNYNERKQQILQAIIYNFIDKNNSQEKYNIDYLTHPVFYYFNKLQRTKLRARNKLNSSKIKLLMNCCQLAYLKYNKNDLILTWEKDTLLPYMTETNEYLPIIIAMKSFYKLFDENIIELTIKEKVQCLMCIGIGIILLNINNEHENNMIDYVKKNLLIFYNIFIKTNGFEKKIIFLIVLLYHILKKYNHLFPEEKESFIKKILEFQIIPTTSLQMEYSNKLCNNKNDDLTMLQFYINSIKQRYELCTGGKHNFVVFDDYLHNDAYIKCNKEDCGQECQYEINYEISMDRHSFLEQNIVFLRLIHPGKVFKDILSLILKNNTFDIKVLKRENNEMNIDLIEMMINISIFPMMLFGGEENESEFSGPEKELFKKERGEPIN